MKTTYGDQRARSPSPTCMVIPAGRPVVPGPRVRGRRLIGGTNGAGRLRGDPLVLGPAAAGKQDVVPDRTNHILFRRTNPGMYFGQCAEFCGLQHGRMKFRVVALLDPQRLGGVGREPEAAGRHADGSARREGDGPVPEPASRAAGQLHGVSRRRGASAAGVNAAPEPDAFRRSEPRVLRRAATGRRSTTERRTRRVAARPERREARREDAQLPPDARARSTRWWPTSRA